MKRKKPWLGLIGLLLLLPGCGLINVGNLWWLSIGLIASGTAVLAYAVLTGNVALFG